MKPVLFLFVFLFSVINLFSQDSRDLNGDGLIESANFSGKLDINGDGISESNIPPNNFIHPGISSDNPKVLNFYQYWVSASGSFSNCWDGAIGYFDNDTLLDIAGYTFNPNKFYIWEQSAVKPDSFALVYEYTKTDAGGFGPITFGDTDGDSLTEIILADLSTMTRIYIFENTGNNTYENKNTQTTLTHTNDGETGRYLYIADLNKNGKKEIICGRGTTSGGMIRIWEQSGVSGQHTYSNIYSYTTSTYIFSQGGLGDSDNNGYDEIFLTYGGSAIFNTYIRRIQYDSASAGFVHLMFQAPSVGMPASYRVADINNDGIKELIATQNSNSKAALYIYKYSGSNTFTVLDSVFEVSDNNNLLSQDIKTLQGDIYPSILTGSYNGKIYIYRYNGTSYSKTFEKLDYPGAAIRRVYWTILSGTEGYFNTWSSSSSDGLFYLHRRQPEVGISSSNSYTEDYRLENVYPNPFNPSVKIRYSVKTKSFVSIKIFDLLGQEVGTLVNGFIGGGSYEAEWNAGSLSGGIYFCRMQAGNYSQTKKLILLK